jgi:hypothetical protein
VLEKQKYLFFQQVEANLYKNLLELVLQEFDNCLNKQNKMLLQLSLLMKLMLLEENDGSMQLEVTMKEIQL